MTRHRKTLITKDNPRNPPRANSMLLLRARFSVNSLADRLERGSRVSLDAASLSSMPESNLAGFYPEATTSIEDKKSSRQPALIRCSPKGDRTMDLQMDIQGCNILVQYPYSSTPYTSLPLFLHGFSTARTDSMGLVEPARMVGGILANMS